jgi:hypothetical protein
MYTTWPIPYLVIPHIKSDVLMHPLPAAGQIAYDYPAGGVNWPTEVELGNASDRGDQMHIW